MISKTAANYIAHSDNPLTTCARCQHFINPGKCRKVEGRINPGGWCRLWTGIKTRLKRLMGKKP